MNEAQTGTFVSDQQFFSGNNRMKQALGNTQRQDTADWQLIELVNKTKRQIRVA